MCVSQPEAVVGGQRSDSTGFSNPGDLHRQQEPPSSLCVRVEPPAQPAPSCVITAPGTHARTRAWTHIHIARSCPASRSNASLASEQCRGSRSTSLLRVEGLGAITRHPASMWGEELQPSSCVRLHSWFEHVLLAFVNAAAQFIRLSAEE